MNWVKCIITSFSAFSRIPMPKTEWNDNSLSLSIAFLPLVGAAVGGGVWLWGMFCREFGLSAAMYASGAAALPIIITGGIHMDGFCDTVDALSARQNMECSLEILKDPHVGAFAVMGCVIYILLSYGSLCQLYLQRQETTLACIYILSRSLSAYGAITMKNARKNGMLTIFTSNTHRRASLYILFTLTTPTLGWLLLFVFPQCIGGLLLCAAGAFWCRNTAYNRFGGATGDIIGYNLQITELALLWGLAIGGALWPMSS